MVMSSSIHEANGLGRRCVSCAGAAAAAAASGEHAPFLPCALHVPMAPGARAKFPSWAVRAVLGVKGLIRPFNQVTYAIGRLVGSRPHHLSSVSSMLLGARQQLCARSY